MKRILCFGDSNTWGHNPESKIGERFDNEFRWVKLLEKKLGKGYSVIEEGLCGRTINTDYLTAENWYKNGYKYLVPCLKSHNPLSLVIIMLGTNDLKNSLKNTTERLQKI